MNELHLFAGAGGGILGGMLLGHTPVCAVEIEPYCRKVLLQRQRDGILPRFPIWDDVTTFDGIPWRGQVDIVAGGFPCQDISAAGKGGGLAGKRSGLWSEMARIIGEVKPKYVFVENSPLLTGRGLDKVLMDLAAMGYDAEWCVLGACDAGAPHKRERIWILAHAAGEWRKNSKRISCYTCLQKLHKWTRKTNDALCTYEQNKVKNPCFTYRNDDDLAQNMDRLKAIGNGQVPAVAALAWCTLMDRIK